MHVCFFNRSYWPDTGATGQLLAELAEDLVERHGWEVTIVTGYPPRAPGPLPARETRRGVHIIRAAGTTLDPRRFVARAANYLTYFVSSMVAALTLRRCDVVVALTDPPIIGLAALVAARRSGGRFVFLSQDVFPEVAALLEDFRSGIVNAALDRINRFLLSRADRVVAIGASMERRLVDLKGADPARVRVIHNWADTTLLAPGSTDNAFAREQGLAGRFVVLHAGNIGQGQDLDVMLDAAARLRDVAPRVLFLLVGDGTRRAALQRLAGERGLDNVRFAPFQPRDRMAQSYAAAGVCLVSLRRGLSGFIVPSKVYSILAAGRGFVAAIEADSEPAVIAREFGCGVVVPPGDGAALAAAIAGLADDPDRVAQMNAAARAAAAHFDRPRQVAEYARLFEEVAGR